MKTPTLELSVHEAPRLFPATHSPLTTLILLGFCTQGATQKPAEETVTETIPVLAWSYVQGRVYPHMGEPLDATIARFQERNSAVIVKTAVVIDGMVFPYAENHFDGRLFTGQSAWEESFDGTKTGGLTEKEWKEAVKAFRSDAAIRAREDAIEGVVRLSASRVENWTPEPELPPAPPPAVEDDGRKRLAPPAPAEETPEEIAQARAAMEALRAAGIVQGTAPAPVAEEDDGVDASSLV